MESVAKSVQKKKDLLENDLDSEVLNPHIYCFYLNFRYGLNKNTIENQLYKFCKIYWWGLKGTPFLDYIQKFTMFIFFNF